MTTDQLLESVLLQMQKMIPISTHPKLNFHLFKINWFTYLLKLAKVIRIYLDVELPLATLLTFRTDLPIEAVADFEPEIHKWSCILSGVESIGPEGEVSPIRFYYDCTKKLDRFEFWIKWSSFCVRF